MGRASYTDPGSHGGIHLEPGDHRSARIPYGRKSEIPGGGFWEALVQRGPKTAIRYTHVPGNGVESSRCEIATGGTKTSPPVLHPYTCVRVCVCVCVSEFDDDDDEPPFVTGTTSSNQLRVPYTVLTRYVVGEWGQTERETREQRTVLFRLV